MKEQNIWKSFELRIILIILFITLSLSLSFYMILYNQYHDLIINDLKEKAHTVHEYVEEIIDENSFIDLNTREDEEKEIYLFTYKQLDQIRRIANILYLYTAKQNESGEYIYVLDGLDREAEDFRHVGDLIEVEIIPDLEKSLNNEIVMGNDILVTDWGIVYVTYFPVHDSNGNVLGAIGMEFDCESLYNASARVRAITIALGIVVMSVFSTIAILITKKIVGNTESEILIKDQQLIAAKEEALKSNRAKSDFLSRMSHEMRTPMNAIIGMTAIADNTEDVRKLRHCLSTINTSSKQLLSLINDILDMSKIEAGKFELDYAPVNIEKLLMKVSNLIVDKTEQKNQKFDIILGKNMHLHFMGDELRLSQTLTNLLSNAVKFTPENGTINLKVDEIKRLEKSSVLQFVVSDNGIGITKEQISRLFESFEQADGSISRRFGGTGLGLSITKSIIEKMNGTIQVESELNKGSSFIIEVELNRMAKQNERILVDGITPADLRLLIVDGDSDIRKNFIQTVNQFGIYTDEAASGAAAVELVRRANEEHKPYDVVFLSYDLPDMDGIETACAIDSIIDKNTVVIMTSFLKWNQIELAANDAGINRFIAKPLFPSSILDAINDIVGSTLRKLEISSETEIASPDFSDISLLLAEDVDINREIFISLLEDTNINIDIAENGKIAVEKFKTNPEKYDMIVMDVQMPEMDGLEATKVIRNCDYKTAKTIPIIAMTANAFKEDVDKCIEAGMNDHLAKPIDINAVISKIVYYLNK